MSPNDSVVQHVTNIQNLASQLKDAGQRVDDLNIVAKILGSLPPKYSAVATAWDSVPTQDQKLGILLERLIKEEKKMDTGDDATTAFAAMSLNKQRRNGAPSRSGVNDAHKGQKADGPEKRTSVECFYCKKKGHIARQCRKKIRDNS